MTFSTGRPVETRVPAAAPAGRSSRRRRHWLYAIGTAALVALAATTNLLPVYRSQLQAYLGVGDERFGLLFSAGPLASVGAVLLGSVFLQRLGPVRLIRFALLGLGAGFGTVAAAGASWPVLLGGLLLCGVFRAPLLLASAAYLTRLFPRERRRVLALLLVFQGLVGVVLPALGEGALWLVEHAKAVPFAWVVHGPYAVVGAIFLAASARFRTPRRVRRPLPAAVAGGRRRPRFSLALCWLAVLVALHGAIDSTLHVWMARFLESDSFAAPLANPGLVLSGFGLAYLVSRALLMTMPDRRGERFFLAAPGVVGGLVLAGAIITRDATWTAVGYVAGAFLWSVELPAFQGAMSRVDKAAFGYALAGGQMLCNLFTCAGIAAVGQAVARWGETSMWCVMFVLALGYIANGIGGGLWWFWHRGSASARPGQDEAALRKEAPVDHVASRSAC